MDKVIIQSADLYQVSSTSFIINRTKLDCNYVAFVGVSINNHIKSKIKKVSLPYFEVPSLSVKSASGQSIMTQR